MSLVGQAVLGVLKVVDGPMQRGQVVTMGNTPATSVRLSVTGPEDKLARSTGRQS